MREYGVSGFHPTPDDVGGPDDQREIVVPWVMTNATAHFLFLSGARGCVEDHHAFYDRGNRRREAVLATRARREGCGNA